MASINKAPGHDQVRCEVCLAHDRATEKARREALLAA